MIYRCDDSGSLKEYVDNVPRFKTEVEKAIYHLKIAHTMVQRIDWYLSGDDGCDSFTKRLEEDLLKIEKYLKYIGWYAIKSHEYKK